MEKGQTEARWGRERQKYDKWGDRSVKNWEREV